MDCLALSRQRISLLIRLFANRIHSRPLHSQGRRSWNRVRLSYGPPAFNDVGTHYRARVCLRHLSLCIRNRLSRWKGFSLRAKSPRRSLTLIGSAILAGGAGSTQIPVRPVPAQSDHSLRCGNAVCSPSTAPSFAQRHVPAGTESAPVHRRPHGKRAVRETESDSPLLSVSRHPK
jgi:hypothetical protein